jgi:hypothetical protein
MGEVLEAFIPATHQVPVAGIGELTGLDFAHFVPMDPLDASGAERARASESFEDRLPSHVVESFEDLIL